MTGHDYTGPTGRDGRRRDVVILDGTDGTEWEGTRRYGGFKERDRQNGAERNRQDETGQDGEARDETERYRRAGTRRIGGSRVVSRVMAPQRL